MSLIEAGLQALRDKLAAVAAEEAAERASWQASQDYRRDWFADREREGAIRRGGERLRAAGFDADARFAALKARVSPLCYPRATIAPAVAVPAPEPAPVTFTRTGGFGPSPWKTTKREWGN